MISYNVLQKIILAKMQKICFRKICLVAIPIAVSIRCVSIRFDFE